MMKTKKEQRKTKKTKRVKQRKGIAFFPFLLLAVWVVSFSVAYFFTVFPGNPFSFAQTVVQTQVTTILNEDTSETETVVTTVVVDEDENSDTETEIVQKNDLTETALYHEIKSAVMSGESPCYVEISRYSETSAEIVYETVQGVLEDPELFWADKASTRLFSMFGKPIRAEITFTTRYEDVQTKRQILAEKVEEILAHAPLEKSDYEIAKYFHDYLVTNITYGEGSAGGQDIYAALVEGECVCRGYATAYTFLMQQAGIDCGTITGTAEGGPHAWNYAKLDGEYFYSDVTWDDKDMHPDDDPEYEYVFYHYFTMTLEEISMDHTAENGQWLPEANSIGGVYYEESSLIISLMTSDDFDKLKDAIRSQLAERRMATVKCVSKDEYNAVVDCICSPEMIQYIKSCSGIKDPEIRYVKEDAYYIVTVLV